MENIKTSMMIDLVVLKLFSLHAKICQLEEVMDVFLNRSMSGSGVITMRGFKHEKRRQKRFLKRCSVEFTSDGKTYTGICKNLSLDGLFIKTRKPLGLEKLIEMIVHLPDGSTSILTGRVTRATREPYSLTLEMAGIPSKDGMGVQLVEKDANYLNFVTSLISRPYA